VSGQLGGDGGDVVLMSDDQPARLALAVEYQDRRLALQACPFAGPAGSSTRSPGREMRPVFIVDAPSGCPLRVCVSPRSASVRIHGPRVTVVQQRTRCGSIRADPAAIGPEGTPERASVSSDRSVLGGRKMTRWATQL
jgi:hypothetical protein